MMQAIKIAGKQCQYLLSFVSRRECEVFTYCQFHGCTEEEPNVVFSRPSQAYNNPDEGEDHCYGSEEEDAKKSEFFLEIDLYLPQQFGRYGNNYKTLVSKKCQRTPRLTDEVSPKVTTKLNAIRSINRTSSDCCWTKCCIISVAETIGTPNTYSSRTRKSRIYTGSRRLRPR